MVENKFQVRKQYVLVSCGKAFLEDGKKYGKWVCAQCQKTFAGMQFSGN